MAQLRNLSIIVLVIAAAMLLQSTDAAEYIVGGDKGWINSPPGGTSFYSNWAKNHTFRVNDILVFNFETGKDNVAIVTKHEFHKCKMSESTPTLATGPARVTLNHTGKFFFASTFTGHCSSGQRLKVKVTDSSPSSPSSSPAPAKAPPAAGTPSPLPSGSVHTPPSTVPGAIAPSPPPHKGSATTLPAATFSLLLITIAAFNVLFH